MLKKRNIYAYLLTVGVGILAPLASYAQQCDQTFSPITIRQGGSYTISDSLTNSSSNPYVVEHFGIEYQGGPSQYVQGSAFTNQPFGSLASDIVDGGAVNRALGGVNGFVVTNAQSRDFLIRFKVTGYHISSSDACITNPSLPCTALSYGDHYECQPLIVTKCGDGVVDGEHGEQCDGGPNCNASCQIEAPQTYCGDGVKQSPNTHGQYEQCDGNDGVGANQYCTNSCELVNIQVCEDPNAENHGQEGACIYRYACTDGYQCIQQKGGQYSDYGSCDNACNPPQPYCGDGVRNNGEQCDYNDGSHNGRGNGGCNMSCEPIQNPEPPLHCEYYWNDWGVCENGQQTRYPVITQHPQNGGNVCPGPETRPCGSPQPYCNSLSISSNQIQVGQSINYSCDGGNGGFEITGPDGFMSNGSNGSIAINSIGTHTIICKVSGVTNGACQKMVTVTQPPSPQNSWKCTIDGNGNGYWTSIGYVSNAGQFNPNHVYAEHDQVNYSAQPPAQSCQKPIIPTGVDVWTKKTVDKKIFTNVTGEIITWTIEYGNRGPEATRVAIADIIPKELTYLLGSIDATKYIQLVQANSDGTTSVTWTTTQALTAGQSDTLVVRTKYKGGYPAGHIIKNTVCVDDVINKEPSDKEHDNCSNDTTKPEEPTTPRIDLEIKKVSNRATFPNNTGELITWTIAYKNNGPSTGTNVIITDALPEHLEFVSSTPSPTLTGRIARYKPGEIYDCHPTTGGVSVCVDPYVAENGIQWNIGTLKPGQTGSISLTTRYLGGVANGTLLKNTAIIKGDQQEDDYTNNEDDDTTKPYSGPISCNQLTVTTGSTASGFELSYNCSYTNSTTVRVTIAQSDTVIFTGNTATGSILLSAGGPYVVQCSLDNGVTYKIQTLQAKENISCAYKKHKTQDITCAVKSAITPSTTNILTGGLVTIPTPYIYCSQAQLDDTSYECVAVPAGSTITTKDENACRVQIEVKLGKARLGDRLWYDKNRNGIQDDDEIGLGGAKVELLSCASGTLNQVLATTTTNGSGLYLFDGLEAGSYKVRFTRPNGFSTFTAKNAGSDDAKDSDVDSSGVTECVNLAEGDSNMTIDAGVYNSGGGGGGWFCGDGHINAGEQCDDGNRVNGDGCSSTCQLETTPPTRPPIKMGYVECSEIDPPSINAGEYLPFWWTLDEKLGANVISNCSQATTYQTNVLRDGALCYFSLSVGDINADTTKYFTAPCFEKEPVLTYSLFNSYVQGANQTDRDSFYRAQSASLGGISYLTPSFTSTFTKYGEYKIRLEKIMYYTCDQTVTNGKTTFTKSSSLVQSMTEHGFGSAQCQFNFNVTAPYFVQKGSTLGDTRTSSTYTNVINNFYAFTQANAIVKDVVQTSQYQRSQNLNYLTQQFIDKYVRLATVAQGGGYSKVPNANIYVNNAGGEITISAQDTTLNGTVIFPNASRINLIGSVRGVHMVVAPRALLTIKLNDADKANKQAQTIKGIYIVDKVDTTNTLLNDDLGSQWVFDGRLVFEGVIIASEGQNVTTLANTRRSTLNGWFNNKPESKVNAIMDGAAFTMKSDLGIWTNLPPGANELMTALQVYK